MSRSTTLLALRTQIRQLADIGPDNASTTARYSNARLNALINQSWQRLREKACLAGNGLMYLKSATATMTPGALANTSFGTISMPSDCLSVHGLDVQLTSTNIRELIPVGWGDRNTFADVYGGITGQPMGFMPYNIGVESGASITAGTIAIFPAPDRGYTYTLWYLPVWVDKTSDTDVFDSIAGHEMWAIWECVLQLAAADADMANVAVLAQQERAAAELLLTQRVNKLQRVGPVQRRDVAARNRINAWRGRWRVT